MWTADQIRAYLVDWSGRKSHDPGFLNQQLVASVMKALHDDRTTPLTYEQLDALRVEVGTGRHPAANPSWSEAMTKDDLDKRLGISPTTRRDWVKSGLLVVEEINKQKVRVRLDSIERLSPKRQPK